MYCAVLTFVLFASSVQAQVPSVYLMPPPPHQFVTPATKDYDGVYARVESLLKDKQKNDYTVGVNDGVITLTVMSVGLVDTGETSPKTSAFAAESTA